MATGRRAVIGLRRLACVVALAFAGCGDEGSIAHRTADGGEPVASSGPLQACIRDQGGDGTELKRPSEGFSGIPTTDAFDVVYADGTSFSVAVEQTPEAARRLETETEGVLVGVELANQTVFDEAPAEMRDAAAETVHRVGNVVILYGAPRHDDDTGVQQCLTEAR
jgi:hypothetical protein